MYVVTGRMESAVTSCLSNTVKHREREQQKRAHSALLFSALLFVALPHAHPHDCRFPTDPRSPSALAGLEAVCAEGCQSAALNSETKSW
jgi:hypothetical protein